ncbi:MAG TPA: hydrogen peroxide-dependent heme synthase [Gemmatimonadaceae bacterium]|nr:hydrogen peroxide-dependent heme synthase [Gemmatimonadaceae bacterium]
MPSEHAPETIEGWYALHQIFTVDHAALRADSPAALVSMRERARDVLRAMVAPSENGWSVVVRLVGSSADVMFIHFRPTLDALGDVQHAIQREPFFERLHPLYTFLSVTEAGLYHATAQLAGEATTRGGSVGDDRYQAQMAERVRAERESTHVRKRLFPELPGDMPYVSFYPMSKRRNAGENWYTLSLDDRSRLMHAHGLTGRRYAGRIMQVITGAIGLDAWEWGVTLFARDPLDFKKLVTDMRFDEVSAKYAEFGDFYVGRVSAPEEWLSALL